MEEVTAFESHIDVAIGHNVAVLFLCMCGMLFNIVMLAIFCTRKQARGSVYTTYMIQIAITDLMVCVVWLVMTSMYLHALPTSKELKDTLKSEAEDTVTTVNVSMGIKDKNFSVYRFTYAIYNLHYYNNIFLLATMSVERCVAVWKSLRCQRYQFNRKFIYVVSVLMWVLAFACAIPSFVNPDLITDSEQPDVWLREVNRTNQESIGLPDNAPSQALLTCYEPLRYALENNQTVVRDYNDVSVLECLRLMEYYSTRHNDTLEQVQENAEDNNAFSNETLLNYEDEDDPYGEYPEENYEYNNSSTDSITMDARTYKDLLHITINLASEIVRKRDIDDVCDPRLSYEAKQYQIIVNLIIGFFIPFIAILVTNLAIAFMIGKRARHRLQSDNGDDCREDSNMRRMSDFLRQFSPRSESKTEGEATGICKQSPTLRKKTWHSRKKSSQEKERKKLLNPEKNNEEITNVNPQPAVARPTRCEHAAPTRETRPRLSSFSTHMRRTSGGSASSAESFPTDLTSLHTTSPSPGVRLSAPSFQHGEGRVSVQRACSADSSTTGSGGSHGHPGRRWSSEVFKPSHFEDEKKTKNNNVETGFTNGHQIKNASSLHSRGMNPTEESAQLVQGSHTRLYAPKPKGTSRQMSNQSNGKGRISSASSKGSKGKGGTARKTPVFKNAERQMRVSKSVLAYVLVFAICWLPQRIVTIIYFTEGFIGRGGQFCHMILVLTRIISFLSVLLNPIVYAFTQRELRNYIRQTVNRFCKCLCPHNWLQKKTSAKTKTAPRAGIHNRAGTSANENANLSGFVLNNLSTHEEIRKERHARNRKRWSEMLQRLGRKSSRFSMTPSRFSTQGNKPSDGTIDEEREEEKGPSSKGPSSSNSFKTAHGIGDWEDWQKMVDMASAKTVTKS